MDRNGGKRDLGRDLGRRARFKLAWLRSNAVRRRIRRNRESRGRAELVSDSSTSPAIVAAPAFDRQTPDPVRAVEACPEQVRLVVLAMEMLGRASIRACYTGTAISVAAPDPQTAEIFRAALAETAQRRTTDRLIHITVG